MTDTDEVREFMRRLDPPDWQVALMERFFAAYDRGNKLVMRQHPRAGVGMVWVEMPDD